MGHLLLLYHYIDFTPVLQDHPRRKQALLRPFVDIYRWACSHSIKQHRSLHTKEAAMKKLISRLLLLYLLYLLFSCAFPVSAYADYTCPNCGASFSSLMSRNFHKGLCTVSSLKITSVASNDDGTVTVRWSGGTAPYSVHYEFKNPAPTISGEPRRKAPTAPAASSPTWRRTRTISSPSRTPTARRPPTTTANIPTPTTKSAPRQTSSSASANTAKPAMYPASRPPISKAAGTRPMVCTSS